MKKKIFVLGTGRSGTHWLGYILEKSPEIKVDIEKWPIFSLVTQAAVNSNKRRMFIPPIIFYYKIKPVFTNKHFADKSHPNIWLAEYLYKYITNSYFIGILRNPYATVSSMLLHKGVMKWIENWEDFPIPNEFLGITVDNLEEYKNMPIEAKCTIRWIAHKYRLVELKQKLNDKLLVLDYDDLFHDTRKQLESIESFLGLKNKLPNPDIKKESLNKWEKNLSPEQIEIIDSTLTSNGLSEFIKMK